MDPLLIEALETFTCPGGCEVTDSLVERSAAHHFRRREHHQQKANKFYNKWKYAHAAAERHKAAGNMKKAAFYERQAAKYNRAVGRHIHWGYHHDTKNQAKVKARSSS